MNEITLDNYDNLVPDSPLHRHLESLLHKKKGRVSVKTVAEKVLKIKDLNGDSAETLVEAFVQDDPRFRLNGDGVVEWEPVSQESQWKAAKRFAVFDLETTSEGKQAPRIMEAGFTFVENGKIVKEWSALVNPQRPISSYVRRLTGIRNQDVRKAPLWSALIPRVLDMLQGTILVAHQALFDYECLNNEISRHTGYRTTNPYMCTVEMSRTLLPGSENYRLETLSQWLDLSHEKPHRAWSDARATAELLCHMLNRVEADWPTYLRPLPPHLRYLKPEPAKTEANATDAPSAPETIEQDD